MSKVTIYHNPRCSKSREALKLIRENGVDPEVREYLKDPLSEKEIRMLLMMLHIKPEELVRKNEAIYKERLKGLDLFDDEWIRIIRDNPALLERPVVVRGKKAIIARPPEKALELL